MHFSCLSCVPHAPPISSVLISWPYWWIAQVMKHLIIPSSPASFHFHLLKSNYFVCPSLSGTDRVSHSHRTTGDIMVSHILIINVLQRGWEHKSFWNECYQTFPKFKSPLHSFFNAILISYCHPQIFNLSWTFEEHIICY
jgi:hypothetical protein